MNSITQTTSIRTARLIVILGITLLMASCGTSRKAKESETASGPAPYSTAAHISTVISNRTESNVLTAKIKARLSTPNDNVSTSGTLRMKRGEVIQISLVDPILGVAEVARIEFSKDKVLIIDRLGRRYLEEPYSKVEFLQKAGISFGTLESLFWNELFQPGKKEVNAKDFTLKGEYSNLLTIAYKDKYLDYSFATERATGKLRQTAISTANGADYRLNFNYDDFNEFSGKPFPHNESLLFAGADGKTLEFTLKLSNINNDSDWSANTKVSGKYQKLDAETILKSLISQ